VGIIESDVQALKGASRPQSRQGNEVKENKTIAVVELSETGVERIVLVGTSEADFTAASKHVTRAMPELVRLEKAWNRAE
jgi:hypothetical protein